MVRLSLAGLQASQTSPRDDLDKDWRSSRDGGALKKTGKFAKVIHGSNISLRHGLL